MTPLSSVFFGSRFERAFGDLSCLHEVAEGGHLAALGR